MYERIVVALDGSKAAELVLPRVEALAQAFGSTVTLVWATDSPAMVIAETLPTGAAQSPPIELLDPTPIIDEEQHEAAVYLAQIAQRLRGQGLTVRYEHPEGPPAEAILDTAERVNADLIAMTTHARGGLGRLVFGSIADEVLRHAPCSLLLERQRDDS